MSRQYVLLIMFFLNSELMFLNLFENLYRKKMKIIFSKKKDILSDILYYSILLWMTNPL